MAAPESLMSKKYKEKEQPLAELIRLTAIR